MAGRSCANRVVAGNDCLNTDRPSFLPYGRQCIDDDDIAAVVAVLKSDWLTTGPAVDKFESAFAEKVGARFAVACCSGTAGLHLAALSLDLGSGDQVIVPTMTFLATANATRYVGGEVRFCDADPETGLMTPETLQDATNGLAAAPRAVFPVHLNGQTADMAALSRIARERGMAIVEDACHAVGTVYQAGNEQFAVGACRHSDMAVFSFHPVKTIAVGEGGMVTTNDEGHYERLRALRNHGMTQVPEKFAHRDLAFGANGDPNPWYYEMPEPGFNYRASDIHCALGLSQLGKLDAFVARRRELAARYDALLRPLAPVVHPIRRVEHCVPAWHLYVVLTDFGAAGVDRGMVMTRLKEDGIGTQVHYLPVHRQPYYQQRYGDLALPGADSYYAHCLSLPLFPNMDDSDVDRVVESLETALDLKHPNA